MNRCAACFWWDLWIAVMLVGEGKKEVEARDGGVQGSYHLPWARYKTRAPILGTGSVGRVESRCAPLELGGDRGGARGKAGTRKGGWGYWRGGETGGVWLCGGGMAGWGVRSRGREKTPRPPMTLPGGNGLLVACDCDVPAASPSRRARGRQRRCCPPWQNLGTGREAPSRRLGGHRFGGDALRGAVRA